jgi:hypothetical protein
MSNPHRSSLAALLVASVCCSPHPPLPPSNAPTAPRADVPLPRSTDLGAEVMGYVLLSDGARLVRELAQQGTASEAGALQRQLAEALGLDVGIAAAIDLRRPAGLALLNPRLLASETVRPFVAVVPVVSRAALEAALRARHVPLEPTPWGFALTGGGGRVFVGFAGGGNAPVAVVAWRADLLDGTRRFFAPRLAARADAPIRVHVDLPNVYAVYRTQLNAMLEQVARMADAAENDPQTAFALRSFKQLTRYVESVSGVELLADLDSGGLTLTARLDGKKDGEWAGYVQQQQPGPAWGVHFLPNDAALVYTTHASPLGRRDDLEAALDYIAGADPLHPASTGDRARWRDALEHAASALGGELAYAVWPGRSGGVGLGGAYRVTDVGGARAAVMRAYDELAAPLGALVVRALLMDPARFLPRMTVQQRVARLANVEVDLLEVGVRWPAGAAAERRIFESMFGPKLVLATAFVGEQGLFAVGSDWSARLTAMIDTATGQSAASMRDQPEFAEALGYRARARVSLSYLETGRMTRLAAGLMAQAHDLRPDQQAAINGIVGQAGRGAIVSTTNVVGERYELTTHVPHSAIVGAARLNGALWRIALSPLVNPPLVPPLPVPPPHVTPSVKSPTPSSAAAP